MIQDAVPDRSDALVPPRRGGVLVALSGGVDSTALALRLAASPACQPVHLAWVRHGFRDPDAEEARIVQRLAQVLDRPLHVLHDRPPAGRKGTAPIPEAWARQRRWSRLSALARSLGLPVVALGHQRQDAVETRLLQLLRGGALRALAGMSAITQRDRLLVWRPLLGEDRATLENQLQAAGLQPFRDPTNQHLDQRRNLARHRLLPALQAAGDPWLERQDRLASLADRALARIHAWSQRFLERTLERTCAEHRWMIGDQHLAALSPALLYHLWEVLAERLPGGKEPGDSPRRPRGQEWRDAVEWMQRRGGRGERVLGALRVQRSLGWLAVETDPSVGRDHDSVRSATWSEHLHEEPVRAPGLTWSVFRHSGGHTPATDHAVLRPRGALSVRLARGGEQLARTAGRRLALKEALFRQGVPRFDREVWPVLCDTDGPLWVPRAWQAPPDRERTSVTVAVEGLPRGGATPTP